MRETATGLMLQLIGSHVETYRNIFKSSHVASVWDYFQLWINKLLQRVCGRRKACCSKVSGVREHVRTQTASPSRGAERRQPAAARRWWRPGGRAADRPTCGSAGPGPALREQPGNNQSINVLQTPRGDIRADVMSEST